MNTEHTATYCKCGGLMVIRERYRRVVYFLHEGVKVLNPYKLKCLDYGKQRAQELEEVPIGSKYAWDIIERIVNLKKAGENNNAIGRLLREENGLQMSNTTVGRIIKVYGRGTLEVD